MESMPFKENKYYENQDDFEYTRVIRIICYTKLIHYGMVAIAESNQANFPLIMISVENMFDGSMSNWREIDEETFNSYWR